MEINIEVRKKQLQNLQHFIDDSKRKLRGVLHNMGWTEESLKKDNVVAICPEDPSHKLPEKSLDEHVKKCRVKKLGYDLNEEFLSEPNHHPQATIIIDNQKKYEILSEAHRTAFHFKSGWNGYDPDPMTGDRLITTFSSDERLAIYDYAVSATTGPPVPPDFNTLQQSTDNKELTYEQRLEQERNAKRRRIKYKAVHTSRKSYNEVLHDVIQNQMEAYEDWLKEKDEIAKKSGSEVSHDDENSRSSSIGLKHSSTNYEYEKRRNYDYKEKRHYSDNGKRSYYNDNIRSRESSHSHYSRSKSREKRSRDHSIDSEYHSKRKSEYRNEKNGEHYYRKSTYIKYDRKR